MLGWMILFILMSLPGMTAILTGYPAPTSLKTASLFFMVLLLFALTTRLIRGRVR